MPVRCLLVCSMGLLLFSAGLQAQALDARLPDAAMKGDLKAVTALLEQKVDVNSTQVDGMTALHWAVQRSDLEMTDLLIRSGADVKAANRTAATPLYIACLNGSTPMIKRLLQAGVDANSILTEEKETALMMAAFTGNTDGVKLLLDRGADINATQARGQTALMWAASESHPAVVKLLIERGANVNDASATTNQGRKMTALLFSARQGDLESARTLVEAGADMNAAMSDATTPMILAILNGHYELADFLLKKGANPDLADNSGRTPLFAAIELRNPMWAQVPWPKGDNLDVLDLIKNLLNAGANPNIRLRRKPSHRAFLDARWADLIGGTAFSRAAQTHDITVLRLLLAHGADPSFITTTDETALMLAAGVGWPLGQGYMRTEQEIREALDLCVALGMDVNGSNADGVTALMGAAHKGDNATVKFLVEHGADLNAKDFEGRTALVWAGGVFGKSGLSIQPPRRQPHTEALLRELMHMPVATNTPE